MKSRNRSPSACVLPRAPQQHDRHARQQQDLVERRRVAQNAIAAVNRPRHRRWQPPRAVGHTREEAAYASNGNSDRQWNGEEIAGAVCDPVETLHHLDSHEPTEQSAHDGLPAQEIRGIAPLRERLCRVLEPVEQPAAHRGPENRGGHDRPALTRRNRISLPPPLPQVDPQPDEVRQHVEEDVRVQRG
jgi:hypothetical protein